MRRSNISLWKNRGSPENHGQKVKTGVGTQTWIADKKITTTSKNTKRNIEKVSDETEKANQLKLKKMLEETNQKYQRKKED